jgi:hypothetical protein
MVREHALDLVVGVLALLQPTPVTVTASEKMPRVQGLWVNFSILIPPSCAWLGAASSMSMDNTTR